MCSLAPKVYADVFTVNSKLNMNIRILDSCDKEDVTKLFSSVFTSSEGEGEGKLISGLAAALTVRADNKDVIGMGAFADEMLTGAIFFTRLRFREPVEAYMLSPVAVSTTHQGTGAGQALIRHGLDVLKSRSVALVVTYGDPAFYAKTGFKTLSEDVIPAPWTLSMPHGWLGQSLLGDVLPTLSDRPSCVPEFNNSAYW